MIQYAMSVFLCAVSVREYWIKDWHGAFYFLLAAGFLALWTELHRRNSEATAYHNCSWFMGPFPSTPSTPDSGKEEVKGGTSNGRGNC